jgi:hypothetical protein
MVLSMWLQTVPSSLENVILQMQLQREIEEVKTQISTILKKSNPQVQKIGWKFKRK